jgi:hypothetical protein
MLLSKEQKILQRMTETNVIGTVHRVRAASKVKRQGQEVRSWAGKESLEFGNKKMKLKILKWRKDQESGILQVIERSSCGGYIC